ncbi:MAG: CgeB family protein [Thermodesulfobacteriota bacterium]
MPRRLDNNGHPRAASFWDHVRIPRFRSASPRVLLITSGYFLQREIVSAAARLGWELRELPLPEGDRGSSAFVESLLGAAAAFRPDFAITVNHLGLDSRGELLRLFERMALPLASWFVDSPRLILHDHPGQPSPWCALFTWDRDTLAPLEAMGFEKPVWLPLASDTSLFRPGADAPQAWRAEVSFVGDSMTRPCAELARRLESFPEALAMAREAAPGFEASPEREALGYMRKERPDLARIWDGLPGVRERLDLERFLTWEATRLHRLGRVRALLPLGPAIAGDPGWRPLLPSSGWKLLGPLDYYRDLPRFYPGSRINFNATSLQMKGAVNQRVFDVPACGGFLLTDWREQMEELFDLEAETACYRHPDEIEGLARHYLANPGERERVSLAARQRVTGQHDYTHRLTAMFKAMRKRYA